VQYGIGQFSGGNSSSGEGQRLFHRGETGRLQELATERGDNLA
ncbi:uncharacterized protein METZ01_LOCUS223818, partial [marine metagenome]